MIILSMFFTIYWQKHIVTQVNEILVANTEELNRSLDQSNGYLDSELEKVYLILDEEGIIDYQPVAEEEEEVLQSIDYTAEEAEATPEAVN